MPLQNRVTPFGEIVADPARGTLLGNRGRLHDGGRTILRPWQVRRWISCELEFKGRRRQVMTPNRWTELFFLDEATAFAAGHRPCAECRYPDFRRFVDRWTRVHPDDPAGVDAVDRRLHAERLDGRAKRTHPADLADLPDGAFVADGGRAWLVLGDRLLAWTPSGYAEGRPRPTGGPAELLTPPSTVAVLRAGYEPRLHLSAAG